MPQPVRSIPKGKINGVLANHTDPFLGADPDLVLLAMRVVSTWAGVENAQTSAFVTIIGGSGSPAGAAFLALDSRGARIAAILAAASHKLETQDLRRLETLIAIASRLAKFRDRLVHWQPVAHPSFHNHLVYRNPIEFEMNPLNGRVKGVYKFRRDEFELHAKANAALAHGFLNFQMINLKGVPPYPVVNKDAPQPRELIDQVIRELHPVALKKKLILPIEDWPDWLREDR